MVGGVGSVVASLFGLFVWLVSLVVVSALLYAGVVCSAAVGVLSSLLLLEFSTPLVLLMSQ